jgi:hypothetical protein
MKKKPNKKWETPKQVVPYDTGKVKIGLRYDPPKPPMTRDEEKIQAALLGIKLMPYIPWQFVGGVVFVVALLLTSVRLWL